MFRPSPKIPRILLLEDEPAVRQLLAESLARCGYAVLAGGSLDDGLSVLASPGRERIDLVVTDSHLGRDPTERKGHLLHAHWRARHSVPPFIFLCGWGEANPPPETCCQVYGLAKPFSFPALLTLVRAVVGP